MRITRDRANKSFSIDQSAFIERLLTKYNINKPSNVPCLPSINDLPPQQTQIHDKPLFQSKLGALLNLSRFTCPSIAFAVNYMSRRASYPSIQDHAHLDKILQYLYKIKDARMIIKGPSPDQWKIKAISDADYAEDRETSQLISGHAIFIGNSLVAWGSKRQNCVSESTTESEYIALSRCAKKATVVLNHLDFLEAPAPVRLLCDNQSTIAAVKRDDVPPKLKHIRVKYHRVKELIKTEGYKLEYIPSKMNTADIFTKPLNRSVHEHLREKLNIVRPDRRETDSSGSVGIWRMPYSTSPSKLG